MEMKLEEGDDDVYIQLDKDFFYNYIGIIRNGGV